MRKNINILIYILNMQRDAKGLHAVGEILNKKYGYNIIYCNDYNVLESINYYKPIASLFSYLSSPYTQELCKLALKYGKCFLLSGERGHENIKVDKAFFSKADYALRKQISTVFTMGKRDRDALASYGAYSEDQICISGNLEHDSLLFGKINTKTNSNIGIALSGSRINPLRMNNSVEDIARVSKKIMTDKPEIDALDYSISFMDESSSFMELMNVIFLCDELNMKYKFILRAHPWEKKQSYYFISKIMKNVSIDIDKELLIDKWYNSINALLHNRSSTSFQFFLLDKPAISISKLSPEPIVSFVKKHNYEQQKYIEWQWCPSDTEECVDLLKQAINGSLSACPEKHINDYNNYLQFWFNINRTEAASDIISSRIAHEVGELNENIANNQATFKDGIRLVRNNLSALLRNRDEMMNTWIKK